MIRFKLPKMTDVGEVISFLYKFLPELGRELKHIEDKIPDKGMSKEEVLAAVRDSAEVKDALYRYIKDREGREK